MRNETKRIYLDNNATTHLAPEVKKVLVALYDEGPLNPSSLHANGLRAKQHLFNARKTIADTFSVSTDSILFTSSATEAVNQLIATFGKGEIITTRAEHSSVYESSKASKNVRFVPIEHGRLRIEDVESAITSATSLLFFSWAHSETGSLYPVEQLAELAQRSNIPLVLDAVAAFGKTPIHSIPDGVTAVVFSGHKIHAPVGIAWMYCTDPKELQPLLFGGGQQQGVRSGTEAVPLIAALARAVELIDEKHIQHMQRLRVTLETNIMREHPETLILGGDTRVSNVTCMAFPGIDAESLLIRLDMLGISASHGSACAAGALEPSRSLREMNYPLDIVKSALRFSVSRFTTEEDIKQASALLTQALSEQKAFL